MTKEPKGPIRVDWEMTVREIHDENDDMFIEVRGTCCLSGMEKLFEYISEKYSLSYVRFVEGGMIFHE